MVNSVLAFFGVEKDSKTSGDSGVFYDIGTAIIDGFKNGIVNMVTTLWDTYIATPFQGFVDSVLAFFEMNGVDGDSDVFSTIGVGIVQGLINGIGSMIDELIAAAVEIASSIPDTVRDWLNEHSPSQVMFNIGVNVVQGLINGIESKMKALESVVAQMAQVTISGAETEYEMMSPSHVFDEMGQNLMLGLSNGVIRTASKVSGTINKAIGSTFGSSGKSLSMPVSVSAMPMAGGNTVTFGDVYLSDRIDLATLKSYVQQMIVER
jgi:hypothetical protein